MYWIMGLSFFSIFVLIEAPGKPRIIGGMACDLNKAKFMIALTNYYGYHVCGGSLLNPRFVLTAAHCEDTEATYYASDAFTRDSWVSSDGRVGWFTPVTKIIQVFRHPEHNQRTQYADIALMKLKYPIEESKHIRYIKLPIFEADEEPPEFCPNATIMGWGTIDRNIQVVPTKLQCANLKTITYRECEMLLRIQKNVICTKVNLNKDGCYGDSGGPLLCGNTQYGISSWGVGCAEAWPAVYTRVDKYLDFINYTILRNTQTRIMVSKYFFIYCLFFCRVFNQIYA